MTLRYRLLLAELLRLNVESKYCQNAVLYIQDVLCDQTNTEWTHLLTNLNRYNLLNTASEHSKNTTEHTVLQTDDNISHKTHITSYISLVDWM